MIFPEISVESLLELYDHNDFDLWGRATDARAELEASYELEAETASGDALSVFESDSVQRWLSRALSGPPPHG